MSKNEVEVRKKIPAFSSPIWGVQIHKKPMSSHVVFDEDLWLSQRTPTDSKLSDWWGESYSWLKTAQSRRDYAESGIQSANEKLALQKGLPFIIQSVISAVTEKIIETHIADDGSIDLREMGDIIGVAVFRDVEPANLTSPSIEFSTKPILRGVDGSVYMIGTGDVTYPLFSEIVGPFYYFSNLSLPSNVYDDHKIMFFTEKEEAEEIRLKKVPYFPDYFTPDDYGRVLNISPNQRSIDHLLKTQDDIPRFVVENIIPRLTRGAVYFFDNLIRTAKDDSVDPEKTLTRASHFLLASGIEPAQIQEIYIDNGVALPLYS